VSTACIADTVGIAKEVLFGEDPSGAPEAAVTPGLVAEPREGCEYDIDPRHR
jgi:hypothetical protein